MTTPSSSPPPSNRQGKSLEERRAERELRDRRAKPVFDRARPLSKAIYKSVYPALKGKDSGATLSSLESRWAEIVGQRLAKLSRPVKIQKTTTGYVLVIEAPSAAAPMIVHQNGLIIERVNLAGGAKIKGLRVQQTTTTQKDKAPQSKPRKPLTPEEEAQLEAELHGVESQKVKQALRKLGQAILTRR